MRAFTHTLSLLNATTTTVVGVINSCPQAQELDWEVLGKTVAHAQVKRRRDVRGDGWSL